MFDGEVTPQLRVCYRWLKYCFYRKRWHCHKLKWLISTDEPKNRHTPNKYKHISKTIAVTSSLTYLFSLFRIQLPSTTSTQPPHSFFSWGHSPPAPATAKTKNTISQIHILLFYWFDARLHKNFSIAHKPLLSLSETFPPTYYPSLASD